MKYERIFKLILPIMALLVCMVLLISVITYVIQLEKQKDTNLEEFGLSITDKEKECYEACDGNYFYAEGSLLTPFVCECGVEE